jgi:hypothetical protein
MRDEMADRLVFLGLNLEGMKNKVKSQEKRTLSEMQVRRISLPVAC